MSKTVENSLIDTIRDLCKGRYVNSSHVVSHLITEVAELAEWHDTGLVPWVAKENFTRVLSEKQAEAEEQARDELADVLFMVITLAEACHGGFEHIIAHSIHKLNSPHPSGEEKKDKVKRFSKAETRLLKKFALSMVEFREERREEKEAKRVEG